MRDDVESYFDDLLRQLDLKKILLTNLLNNEKSASDLIKYRNDAEDFILSIIESTSDLIDEINVLDFNIAQIKDKIIKNYNFDFNKIFIEGYSISESKIIKYKEEVLIHTKLLKEIVSLKEINNLSMSNFQEDLIVQISELDRMSKLKILFPKDLRSS